MIEPGKSVMVREDLHCGGYGANSVVEEMLEYRGCDAEVMEENEGQFKLNVDDGYWDWTPEMLEELAGDDCFCGILRMPTQYRKVSVRQYREIRTMEMPKGTGFQRFSYCPECGKRIRFACPEHKEEI